MVSSEVCDDDRSRSSRLARARLGRVVAGARFRWITRPFALWPAIAGGDRSMAPAVRARWRGDCVRRKVHRAELGTCEQRDRRRGRRGLRSLSGCRRASFCVERLVPASLFTALLAASSFSPSACSESHTRRPRSLIRSWPRSSARGGTPWRSSVLSAPTMAGWRMQVLASRRLFCCARCVLAPLTEELLFRGVLFGWLRQRLSPSLTIAITSIAFAAIHAYPPILPLAFATGVALGWIRERSGSVAPTIVIHVVHNVLLVTFAYATVGWGARLPPWPG